MSLVRPTRTLRALLLEYAANVGQTPQLLEQIGNALLAVGHVEIARLCFRAAVDVQSTTSPSLADQLRVQSMQRQCSVPERQASIEQRIVAKAFFEPLFISYRRQAATPLPNLVVAPVSRPALASLFCYARWASGPLESILRRPVQSNPGYQYLEVLRRFGSYTPLLDPTQQSCGGGYFLSCGGMGIVIDPGFNFIQNFWAAGHRLDEIDCVCVTHAHDDHITDLIGLNSLFYRRYRFPKCRRTVRLYWSRGVARFFSGTGIGKSTHLKEKALLEARWNGGSVRPISLGMRGTLTVYPLTAKHTDLTGKKGVGLAMRFPATGGQRKTFVFTADTGWGKTLEASYRPFRQCDLLLVHIGSIAAKEILILDPQSKPGDYLYTSHLGLIGTARLINYLNPKKVLIGEFGEELAGLEEQVFETATGKLSDCCMLY